MTNLTNLLAKFNKLAEERRLAGPKLGMSDEMLDLELALCDVNPNLDFGSNPLPEYLTKAERFELMTELVFSSKGYNVTLLDKDKKNIEKINQGKMPFLEEGSSKLLKQMIFKNKIFASNKLSEVKKSKYIIVCIGTPVNNQLHPNLKNFINFFYSLREHINKNHIIIIRSSIYPGICNRVFQIIKNSCRNLSYCPERIVQGKAISELPKPFSNYFWKK